MNPYTTSTQSIALLNLLIKKIDFLNGFEEIELNFPERRHDIDLGVKCSIIQ